MGEMEEGITSLIDVLEKIKNNEINRLDIHTGDMKISMYRVSEKLVRIDITFKKHE